MSTIKDRLSEIGARCAAATPGRERRMDAYYYSFDETGCAEVDDILEAVATAGKNYHRTDRWLDDECGPSCRDVIQSSAQASAERIAKLRTDLLQLVREQQREIENLRAENAPIYSDRVQNLEREIAALKLRLETAEKRMSTEEINIAAAEFGAPFWRLTDDNESIYWEFADNSEMVADDIGDLLFMGVQKIRDAARQEPRND